MKFNILFLLFFFLGSFQFLRGIEYFVDVDNPVASDANPGTKELPLKSIDAAKNLIRLYKQTHNPISENIVVWLRGGTYSLVDTISFNNQDSGTAQFPIVYQGYPGEKVVLAGKKTLLPGSFQTVLASDPHWNQINASAKNILVSTNLNSVGITDYGSLTDIANPYLQLFINDQRQVIARWPDEDEQRATPVLNTVNGFDLTGVSTPAVAGKFIANGTSDGVTAFKREALLNGVQYYLYRYYWNYLGQNYRAWFLTTQSSGYPAANTPFWYSYTDYPMSLTPGTLTTGTVAPAPTLFSENVIENGFIGFQKADTADSFYFLSDRILTWGLASDIMVHGFMNWLWADSHSKITSINNANRKVVITPIPVYGIDDSHNGRLFVYNLIEEITKPGEWYLDKVTGKLYLWPTSNFNTSKIAVSVLNKNLIHLTDAKFIKFKSINFDGGRKSTVDVLRGQNIDFDGCEFLNSGLNAIGFNNCTKSSVQNSTILGAGKNGIWTYNWNLRTNLDNSELLFQNCEISHVGQWIYAYMCAFNLDYSVGVSILNNEIHDLPHTAILFSGNENKFLRNKIYDVCKKTSDAGAIYCGRDWAYRGTLIKHNFIYNVISEVGPDAHGLYFDDAVAGNSAIGNILYNIKGFGIHHGGGRDLIAKSNLFYKCRVAYFVDDRGRKFINNIPNDTWNFFDRMTNTQVNYKAEPWKSKYPLLYAIPNDWAQASNPANKWLEPGGTIVKSNLGFQNDRFLQEYATINAGESVIKQLQEYANNVEDTDPLFKDKDQLDFELLPNSPAFLIPGFENIPFHKIGLFKNTTSVITATTGPGGSISPLGNFSVKYGYNQTYTMTPADGYEVESVLVDGISVGAVLSYTFSSVIIEHTISVTFKIKNYTITATAGANGSISPLGVTTLTHGASQAFTITPTAGFVIVDVLVDGVSAGALSMYSFTNVIENHSIAVSFALKTYTLTSSAGANGSITPLGAQIVAENSNLNYTITPDTGYQIQSILVDGVSVAISGTYLFSNILADHQIAVTFSLISSLSITSSASSGGVISPLGVVKVAKGGNQTFSFSADTGYIIDDVLVDGVSKGKISSFSFENVIVNHTIFVQFKASEIIFAIVASVEGSGSISPAGTTAVSKKASQAYVITAAEGFEIQSVLVDNVSVGNVSSYTFVNVVASHTIKAIFVLSEKTFLITALAFTNGLISPNGNISVAEGENISYSFIPNANYQVSEVIVDGINQGSLSSYEFENVRADHFIQAHFSKKSKVSKKELLTFSFKDLKTGVLGIINDQKVSIVVPTGTNLTDLVASYTFVGSKVLVNGVDLISGVSKIDYRETVEVAIMAEDGSKKKYQVTVFEAGAVASGLVGFEHSSYSASESSGKAVVTINRFGGAIGIAKVKYETFQNTAMETADYTKVSGELIWQDGDSANKTIEISLVDDGVDETDETFSLKILSIEGAAEGSIQSTEIVIRNLTETKEAGAGGCSYSPLMTRNDQIGNFILMMAFWLMFFFFIKRRKFRVKVEFSKYK